MKPTILKRLALSALLAMLLSATGSGLRAATITVSSAADSGPGSLRAAIASAVAGDTIVCAVTEPVIVSTVGDNTYGPSAFAVTKTLTIEGEGATIQRDAGVANLRLFYVSANGNLTLRNVTLRDGRAQGGKGGDFYQRGGGGRRSGWPGWGHL